LKHAIIGAILSPTYLLAALALRPPGLGFRLRCTVFVLRLIRGWRKGLSLRTLFYLLVFPMDSTRYFEFDFSWRALRSRRISRYLDVSSPRLFPLMLLATKRAASASLINPDPVDLRGTADLVNAASLNGRCSLSGFAVEDCPFPAQSFDVVTSLSVIEHIPEDTAAIRKIWELLKPGGKLIVTLPCAATAWEQYINRNEYGLLRPDVDGFVFFQRFYDQALLQERILSITGSPRRFAIYGERERGLFSKNAAQKRSNAQYPYWREPVMMAREYSYFAKIEDLPGEGVIAMEFEKS
jgi:SAM-dependent methyltransferase